MAIFLVESYDWQLLFQGAMSDGALGQGGGPESIYLHLVEADEDTMKRLVPRVDESGNRQSDRLTLAGNEEWWIPITGRKAWPKTVNPKVMAGCVVGQDGIPRAKPVSDPHLAALKKAGAKIPG
ncbi:MAG: hypothetical protein R3B72_31120 [Polyangiaceae bacterium]